MQSSYLADAGDVGVPSGISRPETASSTDDETFAPVSSSSSADAGSLSTLAMIILSYNKNDARLAIDNVRQGSSQINSVALQLSIISSVLLHVYMFCTNGSID